MRYVEMTIPEVMADGTVALRRVLVPVSDDNQENIEEGWQPVQIQVWGDPEE